MVWVHLLAVAIPPKITQWQTQRHTAPSFSMQAVADREAIITALTAHVTLTATIPAHEATIQQAI